MLICQHLFAMNFSSSSPPHTHSQYLCKFLCMHMYVHPQRQSDTHPHEHKLTYTNAGSTTKIVSELIIFILSSRSFLNWGLWVPILVSTQAQVITRILGLQKVLYFFVGGLSLFHRSYIGLITNQIVHKTWAL